MQSFRTRILGLLLAIVVTTQLATMLVLVVQTHREAQSRAQQQLSSGGRVLANIMHSRAGQLRDAVHVLVADYGFKEAVTFRRPGHDTFRAGQQRATHRCGSGCVLRSRRSGGRDDASRPAGCERDALAVARRGGSRFRRHLSEHQQQALPARDCAGASAGSRSGGQPSVSGSTRPWQVRCARCWGSMSRTSTATAARTRWSPHSIPQCARPCAPSCRIDSSVTGRAQQVSLDGD